MTVSLARADAAADQVEQQGKDQREEDRRPGGLGEAAKGPDGHAGEGGVAQGVGEEGHPAVDHHGGQDAEQRGDDQHRQQGVFHEVHGTGLGPLKGQQVHQGIPELHHALPPFPHPQMEGLVKFRGGEHLVRRARLQHPLVEQDHLVGELAQGGEVVGGQEDGQVVLGAQLVQHLQQLVLPLDVHAGQGLVQDQDVGHRLQGQGQQHPLELAAGQASHGLVQQVLPVDPGQAGGGTAPGSAWGRAGTPAIWRWRR